MRLGFLVNTRLVVFVFLRGAEATCANVLVRNLAVHLGYNLMNIGFESAFCLSVGVTYVVSRDLSFTAYIANSAHNRPPKASKR